MEDGVPVKRVSGEVEAELVCGLLRSAGIECGHRMTDEVDSALEGFGGGPHEVLVFEADLAAAREVLAQAEGSSGDLPA